MKSNLSPIDRLIRLVIALIIAIVLLFDFVRGTGAIILGIIGILALLTGALNFCFLYGIFGFSTKKEEKED